jgi:hypothetical protein
MDLYQKDNFPNRTDVKKVLKDYNFNLILNVVKAGIMQANTQGRNTCPILNIFAGEFESELIAEARQFLVNKGYSITNILNKDDGGDSKTSIIGWNLEWS